jgi:hypothetical protein
MTDIPSSPVVRRFVEITFPSFIKEMKRLNDNIERALDYYALEQQITEEEDNE